MSTCHHIHGGLLGRVRVHVVVDDNPTTEALARAGMLARAPDPLHGLPAGRNRGAERDSLPRRMQANEDRANPGVLSSPLT